MKEKSRLCVILISLLFICNSALYSQKLVESVAGIVGNEVIYLSDVENNLVQQLLSGDRTPVNTLRCRQFEELLVSKLFLDQARIDSIVVSDASIDGNLNMSLNDFIRRAGSEKALEDYFKKSMIEIKMDLRKNLMNQEIIREVQNKIAEGISITPADVKKHLLSIPKDSVPVIPSQVQLSIIQLDPPASEENKLEARQKLLDLRGRILAGESLSTLAILYSEDMESAKKGGEIGFLTKGEIEQAYGKEYADAAFSLSKNIVSKIIETKYGFHIIQLIDRKGDMINTRHIMIRPKVKPDEARIAEAKLDSLADQIRKDSLTFVKAAMQFSSHKDSRINGGQYVKNDPNSRVTWFTLDELDKETYVVVRDLKISEISKPFRTTDENGNTVFRIVKLDNQVPAHVANLKDDYQTLYNSTLLGKRSKIYQEWIDKKIGVTYIKISDEFKSCEFANKGWLK
jgi:peptidyl-prolyl cis-trans isomerase SurA